MSYAIIVSLIKSVILFGILDFFYLRWIMGPNVRIVVFLFFFSIFLSEERDLWMKQHESRDNKNKITIDAKYDQLMKKENQSVQF